MEPKTQDGKSIVPWGAAVMGAFLVGMTGIGAATFALRGQAPALPQPLAATSVDDLQNPQVPARLTLETTPEAQTGLSQQGQQSPKLALLAPGETTLETDLLSPLTRVFLGTPPLTPPTRPNLELAEEPASTPEITEASLEVPELAAPAADLIQPEEAPAEVPSGLLASLRPQLRPANLQVAPEETAQKPVRVASLSRDRSEVTRRQQDIQSQPARVPQTPRIVAPSAQCPKRLARDMPRRRNGAPDASAFLASVQSVDGVKRDQQVVSEILKGNMPRFQKNLVPVTVSGTTADGQPANITLCVTPDYLALGSDQDFVRVPLGLDGASQVARSFNMLLPTPRIVDAIYHQAGLRLSPSPMTPGPQMTSTAYFTKHNATVESQRQSAGAAHGTLISGHKKDVVSTSRLASNRGRVAIYGWHRSNGKPIQPLSTVHGAGYADYSHGIRLVSRTAYLNGREVDLRNLIGDPRYAGLISHEGPLSRAALASN